MEREHMVAVPERPLDSLLALCAAIAGDEALDPRSVDELRGLVAEIRVHSQILEA